MKRKLILFQIEKINFNLKVFFPPVSTKNRSSFFEMAAMPYPCNGLMLLLYLSGFNMMEGILIQNHRLISSLQNLEKSQAISIWGGDFPHGS